MNIHAGKQAGALIVALAFGISAHAAAPAAPQVTVGADTKRLNFDWDIVPRSNYYELWFKASDGAPYVKFGESPAWRPHASNSISAHLLDWQQARYQVKACNPSGCGSSPPISVASHMADTIGYFKAGRLHNNQRFGIATAISEDGNTLAALTAGETNPDFPKAAVYIFSKADGRWRQQARLIPESSVAPVANVGLHPGSTPMLSLSEDGNVLSVAMVFGDHGVDSGSVTIYRRAAGTWTQEYQIVDVQQFASYAGLFFAEMDAAGEHVFVRNYTVSGVITAELLVHTSAGWTRQTIPQVGSGTPGDYICPTARLSGNGMSIAWACTRSLSLSEHQLFVSRAPGWQATTSVPIAFSTDSFVDHVAIDHAGTTIAVGGAGRSSTPETAHNEVLLFHAAPGAPDAWEVAARIRRGTWSASDDRTFGTDLALSRDGGLLAILDTGDTGAGTGVLSPPLQPGTAATGATYVYELRAAGPFLRRVLKPNNPIPPEGISGGQVRFANNGKTLAVSEPAEPGNSSGIDGDRLAGGRPGTGAIWLY